MSKAKSLCKANLIACLQHACAMFINVYPPGYQELEAVAVVLIYMAMARVMYMFDMVLG